MASERPEHTLQATALVHEASPRLVDVEHVPHWSSRNQYRYDDAITKYQGLLKVKRRFASVLETGGARRTHLRGTENVQKRHLIATVAHNLSILMRRLFGIGTARSMQGMARAISAVLFAIQLLRSLTGTHYNRFRVTSERKIDLWQRNARISKKEMRCSKILICSTGY